MDSACTCKINNHNYSKAVGQIFLLETLDVANDCSSSFWSSRKRLGYNMHIAFEFLFRSGVLAIKILHAFLDFNSFHSLMLKTVDDESKSAHEQHLVNAPKLLEEVRKILYSIMLRGSSRCIGKTAVSPMQRECALNQRLLLNTDLA